jgi:hypothetical protein
MAAGKLSAQSIGTKVKIKEGGVAKNYIVLSHTYPKSGYTLLMRERVAVKESGNFDQFGDWDQSSADALSEYLLPKLESSISNSIPELTVTAHTRGGSYGTAITKVFDLSYTELGFTPTESPYPDQYDGTAIPYFDSDTKRVGLDDGGNAVVWYTRSGFYQSEEPFDGQWICTVSKTGIHQIASRTGNASRFAFCLPGSLYVQSDGVVVVNTPPVISGSNGNLGSFGESAPSYKYTVTDAQGGTVSVTEALDGKTLRTYNVTLGSQNTLTFTADAWRKVLNGRHTLLITAKDSQGATATRQQTFTKSVTSCSFAMTSALTADAMPDRCIVNVQGKFPEGSTLKVEICNNGNDASPTWEDITQNALNNQKYFFTNKTKTASAWGVKLRATLSRGTASGDCYISSLGGNFQ